MTDKNFQEPDRKFKFGVALTIFFSIFVGFFNIGVLYIFGVPFFGLFLGVMLAWMSKARTKLKIFCSILPVPVILASFYLAIQLNKAEPETFLIPQNFRGKIVLFYEESCGQDPVYLNGRRIYQFPETGVLITNYRRTRGILDQEFYFVDGGGKKTKIPQKDVRDFNFNGKLSKTENEPSREEIGVFYSYAGMLSSKTINKYHGYIISAYKELEKDEKESWRELKQFSEQSEQLLKQCREQIFR